MDPNDELRETFFLECMDLLEVLESGLLELNGGGGDDETVNAVFRAVHSIKGGAGAFALEDLVRFAHRFETALDRVRGGDLKPDASVYAIFLRASDMLSDLVSARRDGADVDESRMTPILAEIDGLIGSEPEDTGAPAESFEFEALPLDMDLPAAPAEGAATPRYEISFTPSQSFYERGNEATLLLRALSELGDAETKCALDGAGRLAWRIALNAECPENDIRDVFEFAVDDCDLVIGLATEAPEASAEIPPETPAAEPAAPAAPAAPETAAPSEADAAPPDTAREATTAQRAPAKATGTEAPQQTVRVSVDRIERVINLVGELVITQAMLTQRVSETDLPQHSAIAEGLDEFKMLTRDIQESVMAIRAQPVKPLFQRMTRIVREAAQATGKPARMATEGEGTEVDKTIVERLADPLTHMIRNAVDHGLEPPEKRAAAGKPPEGVVRLTAAHRSGRIVIEVSDDGGGINREKVREIAEEKGLIAPDSTLSDAEIDNLLFMPGFSTASEISDLSGRGVGMDVVKKAIQALGGKTSITSEPGVGTTFSISLPLTLAVLDGIIVSVADQTIVVPLNNIVETLSPRPDDVRRLGSDTRVVVVRGEPLPIIDVGAELGFREHGLDLTKSVFIITENHEGLQRALVVDAIFDQRQVVIKGLEANYGEIPGIAAATILGDGRIALILDVDVLVQSAGAGQHSQQLALAG